MKIEIYLKMQLEALWTTDRTSYNTNPAILPPFCLRCGNRLHHEPGQNALSRYLDVWICSDCSADEAIRCYARKPYSFQKWHAVTLAESPLARSPTQLI